MTNINIAKEYTPYPGGRYPTDGAGNGTEFRKRFLVPALRAGQRTTITLDGAVGYPSSFLEEAFGGLVRSEGFDADTVLNAFEFVASEPGYTRFVDMIKSYILLATPEAKLAS